MRRVVPSAKLVERVRKLQRLAASPNPHEAEAAAAKAMALMREHALTAADLDRAESALQDPLVQRCCYLDGLRCLDYDQKGRHVYQLAAWKRSLFVAVADYFGLRSSYVPGTAILDFYGHLSDVNAAGDLYEVCARQIDRQALAHVRELSGERRRVHGYGYDQAESREVSRAFRASAVRGLQRKFAELTRESAADHGEEHALVLTRRQEVSNWVDATYTFKKGAGEGLLGDDHGWSQAGYEAGRKLRLRDEDGLEDAAAARRALPGG